MINKNELRIGNIIRDKPASDKFFAAVKRLNTSRCYYGIFSCEYKDLKPILITPEILEKCGFKIDEPFEDSRPIYSNGTMTIDFDTMQPTIAGFGIADVKIEFLHQLQNLYFALYGKELEVNFG